MPLIETETVDADPKVRPTSCRVRAGTSACNGSEPTRPESHAMVRTATRYRSVAMSDRSLSPTSSWTPVMTGVTSSRLAATATCDTASEKASPGMTPVCGPISGSVGYSSTGMDSSVKCADPQETEILESSVVKVTGAFGSRLAMSFSRRPLTRTVPGSSICAEMDVCAETS